jgi:hypothetical protein
LIANSAGHQDVLGLGLVLVLGDVHEGLQEVNLGVAHTKQERPRDNCSPRSCLERCQRYSSCSNAIILVAQEGVVSGWMLEIGKEVIVRSFVEVEAIWL